MQDRPESRAGEAPVTPTLVNTAICDGSEPRLMGVECSFTSGFSGVQLVGNVTEVCRGGKERARAALERLGLKLPATRLVVSFTPADIKTEGNHFDLAIAVSLSLLMMPKPPRVNAERWLFAAEVGLGGELRPVRGVVSFALAAVSAGLDGIVVAEDHLAELSRLSQLLSRGKTLRVLGYSALSDVLVWLGSGDSGTPSARPTDDSALAGAPDFDDMILSPVLERAAMAAAAGMHSLLLRGSPGTGKSMLAARLPSILPPLAAKEHIEALKIYSAHAERVPLALVAGRAPFRAPHHQASAPAILGTPEGPGELSLAHGGVLFLDELPEFRRDLLEALREPLETGEVRVSRTRRKLAWTSRALLVAACNNCPCGWFGSPRKQCGCQTPRLLAYRQRLSGPILDRIDLHVNVPEPTAASPDIFLALARAAALGRTAVMRTQVEAARAAALVRNAAFGVTFNRDLAPRHLVAAAGLSPETFAAIVTRYAPKAATSRSIVRAVRVARTLADLDGVAAVREEDVVAAWAWQAEKAAQERGEDVLGLA
jgi:magnesium chelatase family protein